MPALQTSQDVFHDEIDDRVIEAFTKNRSKSDQDNREIRNVGSGHLIRSGRQKIGANICPCSEKFVKPNGDIMLCGCRNSIKIGDVWKGLDEGEWYRYECYRDYNKDQRQRKKLGLTHSLG